MTISFNDIPNDVFVPGVYVEIDPTGAIQGTPARPKRGLVIGYRLAAGTIAENIPKQITRDTEGEGYWGQASQIAETIKAVRTTNPRLELWGIGVDFESGGTAASGSFDITGTATAAGTISAYVAGVRVQAGVSIGDTATVAGDALEAAINAITTLPVTASNSTGTVTCTCRWKGPEGNDVDLRVNYRQTESVPAGLAVGVTAMASGATSPDLTDTVTAMAGTQYNYIVSGIYDDTNLDLLEAELEDRWGPMVDQDGHLFFGVTENHSDSLTEVQSPARNSKQTTAVSMGLSPTPRWLGAGNVMGRHSAESDPARPRTTLTLPDVLAPAASAVFTQAERDIQLKNGLATTKVDGGGNVVIERLTTTQQKDSFGNVDRTFLDLTTKETVSYLRYSWKQRISTKYPRHKLADDGTKFGPGQAIVTPSVIRGEALAWFLEQEQDGLVENFAQFKEDLVIERNSGDSNRLDALLPPDIINKFVVHAAQIKFLL